MCNGILLFNLALENIFRYDVLLCDVVALSREFMYEMVRFDFLIGKDLDVYLMEVI